MFARFRPYLSFWTVCVAAIVTDVATFAALPLILWWQQEQQGEV